MIFYLSSSELINTTKVKNIKLNKIILESRIILISKDINTRGCKENIITYSNYLYPNADVYMSTNDEELVDSYWNQLDRCANILSAIVLETLENDVDIILLASSRELKVFNYIEYIASYIQEKFHYTSFNMIGCSDPINTKKNIEYAIKTAKSVTTKFENLSFKNDILRVSDKTELKQLMKDLKKLNKKRLKDILKLLGEEPDIYKSKNDMLEMLEYIGELDEPPFL